ncbi:uncharacterized protein PpBr36_10460 [Pyricularia pennisetigena]|uniref:uncharacterized protein n=1 Tax=Pyricularia pennisetigena TaxID=1578925 RepID=UPI00114FFCA7|nr:uncharacterized protein PpBr36_10460 [Pyricularia pennisetigena]TLS21102.1 hypothetical protein PpBr36_10460 [Pyricularia pennisetigena]
MGTGSALWAKTGVLTAAKPELPKQPGFSPPNLALTGNVINTFEYALHINKRGDPYSVMHEMSYTSQRYVAQPTTDSNRWLDQQVPGADTSRFLGQCHGPAGYEFSCSKDQPTE